MVRPPYPLRDGTPRRWLIRASTGLHKGASRCGPLSGCKVNSSYFRATGGNVAYFRYDGQQEADAFVRGRFLVNYRVTARGSATATSLADLEVVELSEPPKGLPEATVGHAQILSAVKQGGSLWAPEVSTGGVGIALDLDEIFSSPWDSAEFTREVDLRVRLRPGRRYALRLSAYGRAKAKGSGVADAYVYVSAAQTPDIMGMTPRAGDEGVYIRIPAAAAAATGPAGPAGPAGPPGPKGDPGTPGASGGLATVEQVFPDPATRIAQPSKITVTVVSCPMGQRAIGGSLNALGVADGQDAGIGYAFPTLVSSGVAPGSGGRGWRFVFANPTGADQPYEPSALCIG